MTRYVFVWSDKFDFVFLFYKNLKMLSKGNLRIKHEAILCKLSTLDELVSLTISKRFLSLSKTGTESSELFETK